MKKDYSVIERRVFLILALVMMSMATWAVDRETCAFWKDGFGYSFNDDKATVKVADCTNTGDVVIPSTVTFDRDDKNSATPDNKTYNVITIAQSCFASRSGVTSLTVPASIVWLDNNCFDKMTGLTKVTFEDGTDVLKCGYSQGVMSDDELFYGCSKLKEVYLGRDVEARNDAKESMLQGVSSLETLTVGPKVTLIMSNFCSKTGLKTLDLTQATSLKHIWNSTFYGCSNLQKVNFSKCSALEGIHNDAFASTAIDTLDVHECTNLKDITAEAFFNCSKLTTVMFPASLTSIGTDAFDRSTPYSSTVTSVYFYGDENSASTVCTNNDAANFKSATFVYLDRIVETVNDNVTFPYCEVLIPGQNMTEISKYCFEGSKITGLVIPANVQKVGYRAFYDCTSMKFVEIADGTTAIEFGANESGISQAFEGCKNLVLAKIGRTVKYDYDISKYEWSFAYPYMKISPFYNCYLNNVIIGDSVKEIPPYIFECCTNLTSVVIGGGVKTVGIGTFKDCSKLSQVTFNESKEPITLNAYGHFGSYTERSAFYDCPLTTFDMRRDIVDARTAGQCLFTETTAQSLESLIIGDDVTNIPANMFKGCSALTDLAISSDKVTINNQAFDGCTGLKTLTIDGDATIAEKAFNNCSSLAELTFQGTPKFGENVFANCNALKSVMVNYEEEPTEVAGPATVFTSDAYKNATLYNLGDDNSFQVDFSKCTPWSLFENREVYVGAIAQKYTTTGDNTSVKDVASLSMEYNFNKNEGTLVSFPFKVDSYYFGSDASIYTLNASNGTYGSNAWNTNKLDLTSVKTLPVNTLMLVVAPRGENLVQSQINMFEESSLSALPAAYSSTKEPVTFSANVTASLNEITASQANDNNVYVLENGILKRVNSTETYDGVKGFGGYITDSSKEEFHLLDAATNQKIVSDGFDVTPNADLNGFATFYCEESNVEMIPVTPGDETTTPWIFTVTGVEGSKVILHRIMDGVINKGQAVLVYGYANKRMFFRAVTNPSSDEEGYADNIIKGVNVDTPVSDLTAYDYVFVLSCDMQKQNVGLYKWASTNSLGAHKAYLDPKYVTSADAKVLTWDDLGDINAIEEVETSNDSNANGAIYDISGRKVSTMQQNNIYINNNKKFINK